jgi:hypothetical protein
MRTTTRELAEMAQVNFVKATNERKNPHGQASFWQPNDAS